MAKTTKQTPQVQDLEALQNARLRECSDEITKLLDRYGCRLVGVPVLSPNGQAWGLSARVDIAPKV